MTFSIISRDLETGQIGIAVASRFFAVGAMVPFVRGQSAIATQSYVNPMWGVEGIERLQKGEKAEQVLADFKKRDKNAARRQVHMLDMRGRFVAFTGTGCHDWCGHRISPDASFAGNLLAGPTVLEAMEKIYLASHGLSFAERLLAAMIAGEETGGDKRGRQSAALLIHGQQDYPFLSIRADDHADPLGELGRLLAIAQKTYLPVMNDLPTRSNFSGG